jgi:DMSO/TMAO reductase YedYZ molybdopterin-dependent catalytic subunit
VTNAQFSRRDFLRTLAVTGLGGWLAGCETPSSTPPPPSSSPPPTQPNFLTTPPPALEAGRLTPIGQLYIQTYSKDLEPTIALDSYQLAITGLAQTPYTLTWADIRALPAVEQMQTLECIGNPVGGHLIGNILWKGVSLRAVLEQAAPKTEARYLVMSAADEYFTAVPLDLALDERSLLAFEANGESLPPAHGFPLRVLLPGVYGQKQPKWVTALRLVENYQQGTWEKQGWSGTALIQINSRIDYPPANSILPADQPAIVSGVAFADTSGVARVEVSTDNGETWVEARSLPGPSTQVWTFWQFEWNRPARGRHTLKARATDGDGNTQSDASGVLAGVFPDGTSAIHSVTITVV